MIVCEGEILLKVIPVLDVLNGVAVHAIRGNRKRYQPLRSVLCESSNPLDLAKAFEVLGFDGLYLADLDSILGLGNNFNLIKQIKSETALKMMADAGINDIEKANRVLENGASQIIIGTETLDRLNFVRESLEYFGRDRVIVSLDLMNGKVLSKSHDVNEIIPFIETLEKIGINELIVLDLSRVGAESGVNLIVIKEVLNRIKIKILTGGGVRNINDLEELNSLGIDAALVSTAIHTGNLTLEEIKSKNFL